METTETQTETGIETDGEVEEAIADQGEGLSSKELAEKIGITASNLNQWRSRRQKDNISPVDGKEKQWEEFMQWERSDEKQWFRKV
ncbi:MAG: hypothetical protein WBM62_10895 [Crocosphaera sp.]